MKVSARMLALAGVIFLLIDGNAASAPASYTIQTVAGSSDVGDGGPALHAAISDAEGVAIDGAGNIFISDANDHRIRKVTPGGDISTVAGDGSPGFRGDGGPATASRLNTPYGIALDRGGQPLYRRPGEQPRAQSRSGRYDFHGFRHRLFDGAA
jgi:hypothetical protein